MCTTLFGKFLWSHRMTNVLKLNQNGTAIVALTSNVVSSNSDCHDFDFRGNTHRESQIWIMGHFLCKFKQKNFFLSYIMCLSLLLEAYSLFRYMPNDCYVFQTLLEWLIKLIYPPTPKIAKKNNRYWLSSELTD